MSSLRYRGNRSRTRRAGLILNSSPPPTAPSNTVLPAITGTPRVLGPLTVSDGTWSGSETITYTYQWKRNGVNIGGATNALYACVYADIGATITCAVTATNDVGNSSATTVGVGPVLGYYKIPTVLSEFTSDIYTDGTTMFTSYNFDTIKDAITGSTAYVDLNAGVNGTGTEGSPYNSMSLAVAGSANIFLVKGKGRNSNSKFVASKNLKVLQWPGFDAPELTTQTDTDLVWSSVGSNGAYTAPWPSGSGFINTVFDRANIDADGNYVGYSVKGSQAAVEGQPGSFWYSSGTSTLYVKTLDGRAPDANIIGLVGSGTLLNHTASVSSTRYIYCENIKFYGGAQALSITNAGSAYVHIGFRNCDFSHSGGTEAGAYLPGKVRGFYHTCKAFYNRDDGFDYNSTDSLMFEWNCKAGRTTYTGTAVNGSTSHASSRVVRVNGNYQYTSGKPLQDIENSKSLNIKCTSGSSLAAAPNDYAYATNSLAGLTEMWLIECTRVGTKGYINFANSVLGIFDGSVGNLSTGTNSNSGTLNALVEADVFV
jgi:hypothetical protein